MANIGLEFITNTKYPDFSTVDLIRRIPQPPFEKPAPEGAKIIRLPDPKKVKATDLSVRDAFEQWEQVPFFTKCSITLEELSYLLWYTQGVKVVQGDHIALRHIPSSGLRYPIETYFVAQEVKGLDTGVYHYLPLSHTIVPMRVESDVLLELATASLNFQIVTRAAATFIYAGIPYRSVWALGNRGYRSMLIDAGHVCQALQFAAASIGFKARSFDLFHDEAIGEMAELDPETEWPLCLASVGKTEQEI